MSAKKGKVAQVAPAPDPSEGECICSLFCAGRCVAFCVCRCVAFCACRCVAFCSGRCVAFCAVRCVCSATLCVIARQLCSFSDSNFVCAGNVVDKDAIIAALTQKVNKMKLKEKKRKNKSRSEHVKVCAAVKPLLPDIKELNYNTLWWLSQYVTHYKKLLEEKDSTVMPAFKVYKNWIYKTKAKADFGEVSVDGEKSEEEEESEEESEEDEEEDGDV